MIAYHFPPFGGGSGIHRTLKFSRYLSDYGWQPTVLTINPRAYPRTEEVDRDGSMGVRTIRAFALDTAKHLSIRGAYPQWMALPDRWMSWWPSAVAVGAALIRKHRPDVIWSTYPIATAHLIGLTLQRWSRLPWVADFRDPMVEKDPITGEQFPPDPLVRKVSAWIEARTVEHCSRAVFTTPGTLRMYADRFREVPEQRWSLIPNGYDEDDFIEAEQKARAELPHKPIVLVHSGVLYPSERDPIHFFQALSDLRRSGRIAASTLKIILRASGHEDGYRSQLRSLKIEDIVYLEPPVPHSSALSEMMGAHGLLIFQATNCNRQIPAKAYECLRAGRPIFAMTDPIGDTAALLRSEGVESIVRLDSKEDIASGLMRFLERLGAGVHNERHPVRRHSRKDRTRELSVLMGAVAADARKWTE